jgi:hypothetical protein
LVLQDEVELAESEMARTHERTWEELLLQYYPIPLYSALIYFPALCLVDLDTPVLLISSFPSDFQTPLTTSICLLVDVLAHALYLTCTNYLGCFALSFILTFTGTMDSEIMCVPRSPKPPFLYSKARSNL